MNSFLAFGLRRPKRNKLSHKFEEIAKGIKQLTTELTLQEENFKLEAC